MLTRLEATMAQPRIKRLHYARADFAAVDLGGASAPPAAARFSGRRCAHAGQLDGRASTYARWRAGDGAVSPVSDGLTSAGHARITFAAGSAVARAACDDGFCLILPAGAAADVGQGL